jgi:hypothetical protein
MWEAGIDRGIAVSLQRGGTEGTSAVAGYKAVVFRCHVMSIIMLVCVSMLVICPGAYFSASPLFLA